MVFFVLMYFHSIYFFNFLLVSSGGFLLDYFVLNFGKENHVSTFRKARNRLPLSARARMVNFNKIFPQVKAVFLGWLLRSFYNISQKNSSQLFYVSLLAEWRGISRKGLDILGKMNMLLPSRTYKRYRDGALLNQKRKVKKILQKGTFVFWVDNFSKHFRKSYLLNAANVPYRNVDYTPFGISEIPNSLQISLDHAFIGPALIESFPTLPSNRFFTKQMVAVVARYDNFCNHHLWHNSTARRFQTFNIPLKLENDVLTQEELLQGSRDGLRHFQPVQLAPFNVGKTEGLVQTINDIKRIFVKPNKYCLGKVDIDIFWRLCKVCYFFTEIIKFFVKNDSFLTFLSLRTILTTISTGFDKMFASFWVTGIPTKSRMKNCFDIFFQLSLVLHTMQFSRILTFQRNPD